MIINNKIIAKFNKENIDKDFDIYRLSKDEKSDFYKTNVLDIPKLGFKAKSVVYTFGNTWYAMFEKETVDKSTLKKAINEESPNTKVEKVDIFVDTIFPNILTQLILNMLYSKDKDTTYSNITGALYFLNNKWMRKDKSTGDLKSFYCLKFKLSYDMYMELAVTTFSKLKYFKSEKVKAMGRYIFDKDSGAFRKKLKLDDYSDDEVFVQKSLNSSYHNTVPFLKFKSINDFRSSKVGIFDKFMIEVEEELGGYITIENGGYTDFKTVKPEYESFEISDYGMLLSDREIVIEDLVQSEESRELVNRIRVDLEDVYKINTRVGEIDKEALNIRIIFNKEYYEKNKVEDPHNNISSDFIVQHRTIESFESFSSVNSEKDKKAYHKKENSTLKKIIQELIIKDNIKNKKISLVNWEKYGYEEPWTFIARKEVNSKENSKNKNYIYAKMIVDVDGSLEIITYDAREDNSLDWEFSEIENAFAKYKNPELKPEGLFYKSIDNINVILHTEQFTMPDYKKLREKLSLSDINEKIDVEKIINSLNNMPCQDKAVLLKRDEFIEKLKAFPRYERRKEINKELKIKPNASKVINEYLYNDIGILINGEIKSAKNRNEYFNPILDIKYFYYKNKLYYFVGVEPGDLQQSLNNACRIRCIDAYEKIEFEEIIRLLRVEFVRNGLNTVLPFPFKYLNEVLDMNLNYFYRNK